MKQKTKLLLVGDHKESLSSLEEIAVSEKFELVNILTGIDMLATIHEEDFALAMIDYRMEEMKDAGLIRLLKRTPDAKRLPIFVMTNDDLLPDQIYECYDAGVAEVFSLPVDSRILKAKLKTFTTLFEHKNALQKELIQLRKTENQYRKIEDELQVLVAQAKNASLEKSIFLANISHELRTPMNSIIGFANLLKNSDLDDSDRSKYITYINNSGKSLLSLINDVIDFAKIEANQLVIVEENILVNELLVELHDIFKEELVYKGKKDIELRLSIPEAQKKLIIRSDVYRLRQILSNLLINAIKFTHKGYIDFGLSDSKPGFVNFFVKDTGIGIAEDQKDMIFERFTQITKNGIGAIQGTGLGLSISKKLVELLNGDISVESELLKGSIFHVSIPIQKAMRQPKTQDKTTDVPLEEVFQTDEKVQILIAEDEEINYFFIKEALRSYPFTIYWGKNGREAVNIFNENSDIQLVLMDIKMPVMDGYEALKLIKSSRNVPVIAQTAYAMANEKDQILSAGFDEYLSKPINVNLLRKTLVKYLHINI